MMEYRYGINGETYKVLSTSPEDGRMILQEVMLVVSGDGESEEERPGAIVLFKADEVFLRPPVPKLHDEVAAQSAKLRDVAADLDKAYAALYQVQQKKRAMEAELFAQETDPVIGKLALLRSKQPVWVVYFNSHLIYLEEIDTKRYESNVQQPRVALVWGYTYDMATGESDPYSNQWRWEFTTYSKTSRDHYGPYPATMFATKEEAISFAQGVYDARARHYFAAPFKRNYAVTDIKEIKLNPKIVRHSIESALQRERNSLEYHANNVRSIQEGIAKKVAQLAELGDDA